MSEPKLISPLLDGFVMGAPISSHHGVRCCPAMKENSDNKYIVKIISVPSSQVQLDALLLTGAYKDSADAMDYFKTMADEIVEDAQRLSEVSRLEGFVSYEDWQVVPMEDNRSGYYIYLLGSYKRSLDKYVRRNPMTHRDLQKLGYDLCMALATCRRAGSIYIDLKPTNIFISDENEYRIGDLGLLPIDSVKFASLPAKYRSQYAPIETHDPMRTLNETVDTYAVGMILYQIYNGGKLPDVPADSDVAYPPVSCTWEGMKQIIMKAISPNPDDRWSNPTQMGQAFAALLEGGAATVTEPETSADEMRADSETQFFSTEEVNAAVAAAVVADSETRVVPVEEIREAVEVNSGAETKVIPTAEIMNSISSDTKVIPNVTEATVSSDTKVIPSAVAVSATAVQEIPESQSRFADEEVEAVTSEEPAAPKATNSSQKTARPRKKIGTAWILPLVLLLVLAAVGYGAFYYYQNYYLQTVDSLTIDGAYDSLTVHIDTKIDESLLTISCTDTYGNTMKQQPNNGQAEFTDLLPNSQYKILLEIEGFHKLVGKTSDVFNTESRTDIISFTGITGAEDGSVMLTFTVEGPEPEEWIITYSAEGEEDKSVSFAGHSVTINELVVPKDYTFTISPSEDIYLAGQTTFHFRASALVLARNLMITSCDESDMTVRWDPPVDEVVESWSVRCYSTDGYDQTIETTENKAVFSGVNVTQPYYVEVTASGMTQPARTSITANPITVTSFQVNNDDPYKLSITWDHRGPAPEGGWLLMYSLDGSSTQSVVKCENASAEISPRIHGAEYRFVIQAADSTSIFSNVHIYNCPNAEIYDEHSMNAEKLISYLVVTPDKEGWTTANISKDDYTDTFSVGQPISVVLYYPARFYIPDDEISIMYVIRNSEGQVITNLISHATDDWHDMWVHYNTNYAELDIPAVPTEPGDYTISIYFNGKAVTSTPFTITE